MSDTRFPLTPMQLGMLLESLGAGRPWVNVEQAEVLFDRGDLDQEGLTAAFRALIARHDALRMAIHWNGGAAPVQEVLSVEEAIARLQVTWGVEAEDAAALRAQDRYAGFAFDGGLGWRARVNAPAEGRSRLLITLHHALFDGRSMAQIVAELFMLLEGQPLPEVAKTGFADFCRAVAAGDLSAPGAEAHFAETLADFEGAGELELPRKGTREPEGARMAHLSESLSEAQTDQLRHLAAECGGTLANLLQGAWACVLSRWQGKGDLAFGTVRSGRHGMADLARVPGCYINTLPLRIQIGPQTRLSSLISALREDTRALHPHEQVAPGDLRQWGRVPGQQALFNSVVMFEKADFEALVRAEHDSDRFDRITLYEEGGQPLALALYDGPSLRIMLEHDPAHVSAPLAADLMAHFTGLLRSWQGAAPSDLVGALPMLNESETSALNSLAEPDQMPEPPAECLVRQWADAAQTAPEKTAIVSLDDGAEVSFDRLDQHSNAIATALQAEGVKTGSIVCISLGRGVPFIASVLAILKVGGAFLPVDPSYPDASKEHMLQDSGAVAVIGQRIGNGADHPPLIDPDQGLSTEDLAPPPLDPGALAYVIYTSGSTGVPKGVQVTRANLLSHIAALTPAYGITAKDRVLQFASLSFDVALEEVFPTLMAGATLILRSEEMAQSTGHFLEEAARQKLTVANLPAMFWEVLVADMKARALPPPPDLRLMITGSERVNPRSLADWRALAPGVRWMNGYGPTEATITATLYEAAEKLPAGDVPIGRPTGHASAYLLAPDASLAPPGAIGELAIGGPAVTAGYIGRPEANESAFRDGLAGMAGRFYLTGDRAQWREDRQLAFFGRNDRQVKVRGFRIDLRQIERAIEEANPALRAVAAVLGSGTPSARLAAWVTGDASLDLADLKSQLRGLLPAHMQPALMAVEEFPETAGGKTDIRALPEPEFEGADDIDTGDALETEIGEVMAAILGRPSVDRRDSFFDLGGHSLLSVELLGRIEAKTGTRIGLAAFQKEPSPSGLARLIRTGSSGARHIVPIQPKGTQPPILAIHILGANEEYFHPLARHLGEDQPLMGVSVGSLGKDTPTGIVYTAGRYAEDINRAYPEGPLNIMAVSLGAFMAFELTRQLIDMGREIGFLVLFDASGPGGRPRKGGLAKLGAHLARAWYLGPTFPARILRNQVFELKNRRAALAIAEKSKEGTAAPTTVFEFIASNERAVAEYDPRPLDFPITLLRAASNFYDTEAGISEGLGWAPVTTRGVQVIDVPGGHLSMLREPHVSAVAGVIEGLLARG